jgi:hypothetical protein
MKLMERLRPEQPREREMHEHEAREREARERAAALSTADLAGAQTHAERSAGASAAARREDAQGDVQWNDPRPAPEPTGKLRQQDVEDAVEVGRRSTQQPPRDEQRLAPLFNADVAQGFRSRWDATQIGFVDDPRQAVQQADELVAKVMKSLAQSFADERARLEAQLRDESASTENLRVALQRYRSFFQRLLSL